VALPSGSKLGPYEILSAIGAGGMGEVYRAKDPRLSREVAIKVLPASFSSDADRLRRFEQEAKAAGILNHPNITAVYDIGTSATDGAPYVVQELLEGETLRELLAGAALSPRRAIEMARQMASGLAAAHEKGIVHRDLKPENVFVTSDNRVKLLDFGIAKLTHPEGATGSQTNLPTLTPGTEPGVVMGTIGYMSPEQVRGKPVDARTDIFSFGAILYEMLSGRRAFRGDTAADTMTAILKEDPPELSQTSKTVPPALERIVRHCLEKSPEARFRSASDIAFDLEAISETSGVASVRSRPAESKARLARFVLAAAAAAALALFVYRAGARRAHSSEARRPLQAYFTQLTSEPGIEDTPTLSPDGKLLAYVSRATGNNDIYVLRVGGRNPINLTKDDLADDTEPAFSPDGMQIAFRSERQGGGIFLVGATGESVRRLTDGGYMPAWAPDGKEIFFVTESASDPLDRAYTSELWAVDVASGKRRRLYSGDAVQPSVSPHGLRVAFWGLPHGSQRDIFTIPRAGLKAGEKPTPVTDDEAVDWNPVWSPDGRFLYFGSNRGGTLNLWRVAVDEASGKPLGAPEPLTTPSRWSGWFSVAADGNHLAYLALNPMTSVESVAFDPVAGKTVGAPRTILRGSLVLLEPDISPDGQWIVLRSTGAQDDLYLLRPDGSALRQLTSDAYRDRTPMWSPDGKRIAFHSDRGGKYEAWTIQPDGSGLAQLTHSKGHDVLQPRWSPDGTRIAWQDGDHAGIIELAGATGESNEDLPRISENLQFFPHGWSSDGRSIYGSALGAGSQNAGIWRFSLDTRRYEKLIDAGSTPSLLKDGRRLLYEHQGLFLYDLMTRKSVPLEYSSLLLRRANSTTFSLSPDNRWLCLIRDVSEGDVWMATLGPTPSSSGASQ
jgi:serine/threonine protein kinase/Tol biopolymer transport system component